MSASRRVLLSLVLIVCLVPPAAGQPAEQPAVQPAEQPAGPSAAPPEAPAASPTAEPQAAHTGTVPSSSPPPAPGGGQRVNPATGAPAAPGGRPKTPPGAGANRMDFTLRFQDGGTAAGSAVTFDYKRDDYAVLTGNVQLHYQDLDLTGDHVEIDLTSKEVVAQGNVILDQGPKRLTGTTLNFDLDTKTGKMLE